jgi:hypothetical protein
LRFRLLTALDSEAEALLRARGAATGRDPERGLRQMRDALADRRISAAVLRADDDAPQGLAIWRWTDRERSYAQVLLCYVEAAADPALGEALVDFVFSELIRVGSLQVIEARMRDESPGARASWRRHEAAFFERCRLTRWLGALPIPILSAPAGYRIMPWTDAHQAQAEQIAMAARRNSIDAVAAPDGQGPRLAENLRQRAGGWMDTASFVALDRRGNVAGHIAVTQADDRALIVDLAAQPVPENTQMLRALLVRALTACSGQKLAAVDRVITKRDPTQPLYQQVGFQATECGEIAIWWRDGRQLAWR